MDIQHNRRSTVLQPIMRFFLAPMPLLALSIRFGNEGVTYTLLVILTLTAFVYLGLYVFFAIKNPGYLRNNIEYKGIKSPGADRAGR